MRSIVLASTAVIGLIACGGAAMNDAGSRSALDAGTVIDAGVAHDGGARDAGTPDSGSADAGAGAAMGPLWHAFGSTGAFAPFTLDETVIASDGAVELRANGGHAASDPYGSGGWNGGSYYNGGTYVYGIATSPQIDRAPFDSITPSFDAITPPGTWVNVKLAVRIAGTWSKDYVMGIWASDTGTVARHSVANQGDAAGDVQTDTLVLNAPADAIRITAVLFSATAGVTPRLRGLAAIGSLRGAATAPDMVDRTVWGTVLTVPERSQMIYANGGEVWCSPTSTSMLLAFHAQTLGNSALVETVPDAADATFDWIYAGNGNWPFNTAHAAAMANGALHGMITRFSSFAQMERLIAAGLPAAISIAFAPGELTGAPIRSTSGHLIVVRGFDANGDVVCNDPAFQSDASVRVTYARDQLDRAWSHSERTVYVLWPAGTVLPHDPLGAL